MNTIMMFLTGYYLLITWITSATAGNLALRQPSKLSSISSSNKPRLPSYAVDGNPGGNPLKCAVSTTEDNPYWIVDLGRTHIVDEVYILGRSDCCYGRMFGFEIRVGNQPDNKSVNNSLCRRYLTYSGQLNKYAKCVPALRGRYVSIHLPGTHKELVVCEVKVNLNPTANIALKKSALQSSMDANGHAARAVDGNSNGYFNDGSCTHTVKQTNPWWRVDLGSSKPVSEVFLVNRADAISRLRNIDIRVGDRTNSGGDAKNPRCGNALYTMETLYKKSFYCKPRRTGRYIFIKIKYTGYLSLCEVKVYSESKAVVENDEMTVLQGFPLSLKCQVISGYPEPFVAWVRDGVVYQNTTDTDVFRHDALNENRTRSQWECIVTNIHGSDFQTFEIKGEWYRMCAKYEVVMSKRTVLDLTINASNASGDESINNTVWFRLQHPTTIQPMQIPESCTPSMHCSTQATGWMLGSHPNIPDGVVRRSVCFSWGGNCCRYNTSILVRRCHGFYVYKLEKTSFDVKAGYCAEISLTLNQNVMFNQVVTKEGPYYALENHVLHTEQDLDLYECIVVCLSHQSCQSINYDESRRYCEMSDAIRHDVSSSDWKKRQGSAHYERAKIISYKLS